MPYTGQREPGSDASEINAHTFLIKQILATVAGSALVRVVSCTNAGGVSAVGNVDVQPLVNQVDGSGNATPHGTVHGLPYARVQGGADAVILDPKAGDIGIAVFCDRDISSVKATGGQANPGSRRQNDMSDGVYLFTCMGATPTQYVVFSSDGISVVSQTKITLQAPQINLKGQVTQAAVGGGSGAVTLQGPVTVTNDLTASGTSVHTHVHGGIATGTHNTGAPV